MIIVCMHSSCLETKGTTTGKLIFVQREGKQAQDDGGFQIEKVPY